MSLLSHGFRWLHPVFLRAGPLSVASNEVLVTLPGSPRQVNASLQPSLQGSSVVLSWAPPESSGGTAVQGYEVRARECRAPFVGWLDSRAFVLVSCRFAFGVMTARVQR